MHYCGVFPASLLRPCWSWMRRRVGACTGVHTLAPKDPRSFFHHLRHLPCVHACVGVCCVSGGCLPSWVLAPLPGYPSAPPLTHTFGQSTGWPVHVVLCACGFRCCREKVVPDGLLSRVEDHEDSVYSVAWSAHNAWAFASLSYSGRLTVGCVPSTEKYKIRTSSHCARFVSLSWFLILHGVVGHLGEKRKTNCFGNCC
jgi:hypothetical protein